MSETCKNCGETWPRDPALEVACPSCRQPIGSYCKRPSGHRAPSVHVERDLAALDAGKMKTCPGKKYEPCQPECKGWLVMNKSELLPHGEIQACDDCARAGSGITEDGAHEMAESEGYIVSTEGIIIEVPQ